MSAIPPRLGGRGGTIALTAVTVALAFGIYWDAPHRESSPTASQPLAALSTQMLAAGGEGMNGRAVTGFLFSSYVSSAGTNLREFPSASARILKKEIKGAEVYVSPGSGRWRQVRDGNITGWMLADELQPDPP